MEDTIDNRIWNSVQTEPTYSSNPSDYVDHWKRFIDAELASLREQLAKDDHTLREQDSEINKLQNELKQKEEVIKELTAYLSELVDDHMNGCFFIDFEERTGAIIEKAKKLLEPQ